MPLARTPALDGSTTASRSVATPKQKLPSLDHEALSQSKRPRFDGTGAAAAADGDAVDVEGEELPDAGPTSTHTGAGDIPMPDPDDPSPDMWPGVVTGDDAIAYYGQYGSQARVKFFYANRVHGSVKVRPYDVVVVPRDQIEKEYFLFSATGVTRINRGSDSEFYSLGEWVREKTMFELISSIGFYKNYIIGRAFRRWHKASAAPTAILAR